MLKLTDRQKKYLDRALLYAVAIIILIWLLFPIYWVFKTSLVVPGNEMTPVPEFIPRAFHYQNYIDAINLGALQYIGNSCIIASGTVLVTVMVSLAAAYAITHVKFGYNVNCLIIIMVAGLLPVISYVFPLYRLLGFLGLRNTHLGLILANSIWLLPISVWIFVGYLVRIPKHLKEAAMIDGYNPVHIFFKVFLPVSRPAIFAVTFLVFLISYGEFLFALTNNYLGALPISIGLQRFALTQYMMNWAGMSAATVISLIPPILVVVLCRNWILEIYRG